MRAVSKPCNRCGQTYDVWRQVEITVQNTQAKLELPLMPNAATWLRDQGALQLVISALDCLDNLLASSQREQRGRTGKLSPASNY